MSSKSSQYSPQRSESINLQVGQGNFKLQYNAAGALSLYSDSKTEVQANFEQKYMYYIGQDGNASDPQASGAYIFRPNGTVPIKTDDQVPLTFLHGPIVDEVHQQINSWIYQITRVYKGKGYVQTEFIVGPIPVDDENGKELATEAVLQTWRQTKHFSLYAAFVLIYIVAVLGKQKKLAHNKEAKFTRHARRLSEIEQRRSSISRLHLLKGRTSDTSTVESGSEIDDLGSPMMRGTVGCSRLAPVREEMQMRARDSAAYYSCDDHFVVVDKTVDYGRGGSMSDKTSASEVKTQVRPLDASAAPHMAGPSSNRRATVVPKEVSDERAFHRFVRLLLSFIVKVFAYFHIVYSQQETRANNPLPQAEPEPIPDDHPAVEAFNVDRFSLVIERHQRLEGKVNELASKPPTIPTEREQSLLDSWNRIKCTESELERTMKVLQAMVIKQLEVTESLEEVIRSNLRVRSG